MRSNCILPSRNHLLICNDACLSRYDEFRMPKHWEKSKSTTSITFGEVDKIELVLDRQFAELNACQVFSPAQVKFETKLSEPIVLELKEVANEEITIIIPELTTELALSSFEPEPEPEPVLNVDTKAFPQKINTFIENATSATISNAYLSNIRLDISKILASYDLFQSSKWRIHDKKYGTEKFLKSTIDNTQLQNNFSSKATEMQTYLFRDPDDVSLRKRKGRKRKASFNEIIS